MRTVLCSTTAVRRGVLLALVAGTVGALALPATPASAHHGRAAKRAGVAAEHQGGLAVLGPAVKYVRLADGSIRQVR